MNCLVPNCLVPWREPYSSSSLPDNRSIMAVPVIHKTAIALHRNSHVGLEAREPAICHLHHTINGRIRNGRAFTSRRWTIELVSLITIIEMERIWFVGLRVWWGQGIGRLRFLRAQKASTGASDPVQCVLMPRLVQIRLQFSRFNLR